MEKRCILAFPIELVRKVTFITDKVFTRHMHAEYVFNQLVRAWIILWHRCKLAAKFMYLIKYVPTQLDNCQGNPGEIASDYVHYFALNLVTWNKKK